MDNTQNSCYTKRKPFEELTLADDFLFCKVMQNKRLCKELLEIILHVKIDKIEYTESQKVLDDVIDEKSVRMDVYVQDNNHTVYDIEMQTSNTKELYWSSFLVTLCSEIMLYIETPLVSYSYSLNEVSHSCTS